MSSLYLIRHGQASFMARDYDVLSDVGVEQSRALGAWLAQSDQPLDALYTGPRKRQRDTAHHLIESAHARGRPYPRAVVLDAFDEYPAFEILAQAVPRLMEQDPEFRALMGRRPPDGEALEDRAHFNRVFVFVMERWTQGALALEGLESFEEFIARVTEGLDRLMSAEGPGRHVAVVTSGGPISAAMRTVLGLDGKRTLRIADVVANASISEFRWRDRELGLVRFNGIPHLSRREWVTYR